MYDKKYVCKNCKKELTGGFIEFDKKYLFCDLDCFDEWSVTTTEGNIRPNLKYAIMRMENKND